MPDFTLKHTESGETAHLEILGFWSERNLVERVALLREAREHGHRVLVAASERLGVSPEVLSEAVMGGVVPFKERLAPKAVLAALETRRATIIGRCSGASDTSSRSPWPTPSPRPCSGSGPRSTRGRAPTRETSDASS